MKFTLRTFLFGLIALLAVGGLLFIAFRTEPVPVDLHVIAKGPLVVTVNADGETEIREVYDVSAPVAGTAQRSPVEVGDQVKAGKTIVAVVEPVAPALLDARTRAEAEASLREAEAALAEAKSGVVQAEEDLAYAQSQLARTQTLVDRGVESLTRLEDAVQIVALRTAALDAARAGRERAASARDRAAAVLETPPSAQAETACCVPILAPVSGVVLAVEEESERPVQAGARLLSIGKPDDLRIVADLLSADSVRLRPGARAIIERWGGPASLEARLTAIEPLAVTKVSALGIEEQRVDAQFEIVSPPESRPGLGHGFSVFLRIVEWETPEALQVPLSALFRNGEGWSVFVVEGDIARRVPVEIGRRNETMAEVTGGLAEGARVVTHPSDAVADGTLVAERGG